MQARYDEIQQYRQMRQKKTPPTPLWANLAKAFIVGGAICAFGQLVMNIYRGMGFSASEATVPLAGTMVFLGALFTGFGWYDELGEFAGMGAGLPITGFANSIVSPAMEFKREGLVQGVGKHMFEVAGPVFVYGLTISFVIGVVRYFLGAY